MRLEERIEYYERKETWFKKKLEEKRNILAGVLDRYDKEEVSYELVEKCSRDLSIVEDKLNLVREFLTDLYYIKESE